MCMYIYMHMLAIQGSQKTSGLHVKGEGEIFPLPCKIFWDDLSRQNFQNENYFRRQLFLPCEMFPVKRGVFRTSSYVNVHFLMFWRDVLYSRYLYTWYRWSPRDVQMYTNKFLSYTNFCHWLRWQMMRYMGKFLQAKYFPYRQEHSRLYMVQNVYMVQKRAHTRSMSYSEKFLNGANFECFEHLQIVCEL